MVWRPRASVERSFDGRVDGDHQNHQYLRDDTTLHLSANRPRMGREERVNWSVPYQSSPEVMSLRMNPNLPCP